MYRIGDTYTSTVLGAGFVTRVLSHTAILVHSNKVESRVEAALNSRQVNIEGKLVIHEGKHLVLGSAVHEVEARADVGTVLVLRYEFQCKGITASRGAVGSTIISTFKLALGSAIGSRTAGVGPLVTVVTVFVVGSMQPAPVGVNDNLGADCGTRRLARALLPRQLRVRFSLLLANLLGRCKGYQQVRCHK